MDSTKYKKKFIITKESQKVKSKPGMQQASEKENPSTLNLNT